MAQLIFLLNENEVMRLDVYRDKLSFDNIAVHLGDLTWLDLELIGLSIIQFNKIDSKYENESLAIQAIIILKNRAIERGVEFNLL